MVLGEGKLKQKIQNDEQSSISCTRKGPFAHNDGKWEVEISILFNDALFFSSQV